MTASNVSSPPRNIDAPAILIEAPAIDDGVECWRLARESNVLDVNSRYAYLLWCRDFAETSVVAKVGRRVLGFITGYRRPEEPNTLLVWQVAVDSAARGHGLAGRMLNTLFDRVPGLDHMETTITPDNDASIALFTGFAKRRGARVQVTELFSGDQLAHGGDDDHEPENKYRIGPIPATARADRPVDTRQL
jgi:L-2,4-diaminobutyric acid acetyltransferase